MIYIKKGDTMKKAYLVLKDTEEHKKDDRVLIEREEAKSLIRKGILYPLHRAQKAGLLDIKQEKAENIIFKEEQEIKMKPKKKTIKKKKLKKEVR